MEIVEASLNKRCVNVFLFLLIVSPFMLSGFGTGEGTEQYLTDRWEITNGLPSNTILSIAQTPNGYLWIGTAKGLIRFDGMKFTPIHFITETRKESHVYSIPDALFTSKNGTLWIGSIEGLTSYSFQNDSFQTYTQNDGLPKDRIRLIKQDSRGHLWISFFTQYPANYTNDKFTIFNASNGLLDPKINSIIETRDGKLLFGTREKGIFSYHNRKFDRVSIPGLENKFIISMYEDRRGDLWIGTTNGLFLITSTGTRIFHTAQGLSHGYITDIIEDYKGNLWVGTVNGLNHISRSNRGTITSIDQMLVKVMIVCIFEDREKNIWAGTYNSGLIRVKKRLFIPGIPCTSSTGSQNDMLMSIFIDRLDGIWKGTLEGELIHCRGTEKLESIRIPGISSAGITSITDDSDGSIRIGTNGKGVFHKNQNRFSRLTSSDGLADNMVTSIFRDSTGGMWFATFDGVSRLRKNTLASFKTGDGLWGKTVYNVYEDPFGDIWLGADKGITVLKKGEFDKPGLRYYLKNIPVTCIYHEPVEPGSRDLIVWAATHGAGFVRLKNEKSTFFTTQDGMTTNFIYQFFEDANQNFWMMSDSGILRVSKHILDQYSHRKDNKIHCAVFDLSDGISSLEFNNEFSRHSAARSTDGMLRFITKKGVITVNPSHVAIDNTPPLVVLESMYINNERVSTHAGLNELRFKGVRDIRFHFTSPTNLAPEKIYFKIFLEGWDRKQVSIAPGKERVANYHGLTPGRYTFRVFACNRDGVWNEEGASITFTLVLPFYKSLLFKLIILFVVLTAGIYGYYIVRRKLSYKKNKYRGSSLNPQYAQECIKKLNYLVEIERIYRDPELSLSTLAEKLSISHHLLSQVLNEKLNRNFSDYINYYRIEEAKSLFQSPGKSGQKIASVAFDVGFNTIVAFYNAFKKFTGMTPAQYKKKFGN